MHSLGIVQWNSTRRDHPGNLGGVFGSGPVTLDVGLLCKNKKQKGIGGGSPVASLMPKSVLSDGRKDQLLRE